MAQMYMYVFVHTLSAKVGNHFADKRRSLGWYSSLADSDHGVCFVCCIRTYLRMYIKGKVVPVLN
jgi:hypothetical protein